MRELRRTYRVWLIIGLSFCWLYFALGEPTSEHALWSGVKDIVFTDDPDNPPQ
jgi:hypothetical protein